MSERYSIADARHNFPRLVREAEHGRIVGLTRRGELVAMLIGSRHYEQLASNFSGFEETYRRFSANVDLAQLGIEPHRLFSMPRTEIPERKIDL